jgi:hypothetical protein
MGLGTAIRTHRRGRRIGEGTRPRLSAGREGGGALIMRGIEFGAAGLVLLFGLGLLFGYRRRTRDMYERTAARMGPATGSAAPSLSSVDLL